MMKIRVILVDDHRMFREALRVPLLAEPDMEIIGEFSSGAETLIALETLQPDIVVIDIGMRDMNGIDVVRKISKRFPTIKAVALSGHSERIYVEEMLKAGAKGYVVKTAGADELITAIRAAMCGNNFLSPEVTKLLVRRVNIDAETVTPPANVLGQREVEVLRLLARGKRSAEIAEHLGIAVATAEVHRRNIKQKTGIHSVAELTLYAIQEGLISS